VTNVVLSSIYLTGDSVEAAEVLGQQVASDWRTKAMSKLQRYGLKIVNPLELAWTGSQYSDVIDLTDVNDSRVKRALELIDQCDALLANLHHSSYGTAMEMFYAYRRGKLVTVIGPSPYNAWILSHSQARFREVDPALDYIIGEQPQSAPTHWALQYETLLSERYEQFPPAGEPDYRFLGGELPVLVLAPHATAHFTEGEFQEPASFTGSLAALLHRTSGCHTLTTDYCCVADPCLYLETPFRRVFADIVKAGQVGAIVILLGGAWHEAPGLQIGAMAPAKQVADDLASRLKMKLASLEPVSTDHSLCERMPLARFASIELNVPTVVVKTHKRYRMPRLQPELFARFSDLMREFITETGLELARSGS